MRRFLLGPRWILSHVLVLVLVVVMVNLSLWQLRRHDERQERNDLVEQRAEQEPQELSGLLGPGDDSEVARGLDYTRVELSGVYRAQDSVVVTNRSEGSAPGVWVLTPLELENGEVVLVNRGFAALVQPTAADVATYAPPEGVVRVEGFLRPSVDGRAAEEGGLLMLVQPDVEEAAEVLGTELLPGYVQLESESPNASKAPEPVPLPEPGAGPHLSYAGQWAIFALIAVVGYPLILRRAVRERNPDE